MNRLRENRRHPTHPFGNPALDEAQQRHRALTNLHNRRSTWPANAHNAPVTDAYGWPPDLPDGKMLERLPALNLRRAGEVI